MCYYFLKDPGTTNIYPDGHTLSLHDSLPIYPQIAEVAIVGVPDARTGERAIAVIVPKSNASAPDVASLAGFLIGTGIAKYKIPEQVALWDALPKNDAGKVTKHQTRTHPTSANERPEHTHERPQPALPS